MSRKALLILLMLTVVMIFSACGKEPAEETGPLPPFTETPLKASNVAREGFAVASSSKDDEGFSNLFLNDGDLSHGFSTKWGRGNDTSAPHYVMVDLAGTYTVEGVKLYPLKGEEAGFPVDFDVFVSTDNENYTKVASVDGASAEQAKQGLTVGFDPVEASYVKLVTRTAGFGSDGRGAYLALAEFEVTGRITTGSNMILNRDDIWLYRDPDTTQQLKVLYYRDGTQPKSRKKLRFFSADPSIARVNTKGLITPAAPGETVIYVYDGTDRASCRVTVKEETTEEFRVSAFYHSSFGSPETYVKGLQILKNAGVEYIEDTRFHDKVGNNVTMYMIYLCNKLGLAYSVCDREGGEGGYLKMTDKEIIATVQKYENRAGLYGLYLCDEPHEEYTQYAKVHRLIQEYNPHLIPHLNLLPPFNFGGTEEYYTEYAAVAGGARRMRYLSFDFYPFRVNNSFASDFYGAIDMVREAGIKYNADTGYYLQSMIIKGAHPLLFEKELRYNASLGAAYGMKNYKWFVALTPIGAEGESFETGLVGPDFEPAANFEDILKTNEMIKALGTRLGGYDAIEVYHTNKGDGTREVPESFLLKPADSQQAIYTLYRANDGSDRQSILVTNKSYLKDEPVECRFSLTKNVEGLRLYDPLTGAESVLAPGEGGVYSVTLEPGACALIILPDGVDASSSAHVNSDGNENLALGKAVFVTSSQAQFWGKSNVGTHFLTDGDQFNGYWISEENDKACELLIDLGETFSIGRVQFYGHDALGDRFCNKIAVSVSEDGVNYTEVAKASSKTPQYLGESFVCRFEAVNARYVRVKLLDNKPGGGTGFAEIEVFAS